MPAYFLTNTASGTSTFLYMFSLQNATTTRQVSLTSLATTTLSFITPTFYPNNNSVTTTNSTFVLTHTVINMNITVAAQLHRVNAAGTIITSGTSAVAQTTAATNTFAALDDPAWSTVCSDRLMLRLTYVNTAMSTQACTLGLDRNTTYLVSTIPINTFPGCPVIRKVDYSR